MTKWLDALASVVVMILLLAIQILLLPIRILAALLNSLMDAVDDALVEAVDFMGMAPDDND